MHDRRQMNTHNYPDGRRQPIGRNGKNACCGPPKTGAKGETQSAEKPQIGDQEIIYISVCCFDFGTSKRKTFTLHLIELNGEKQIGVAMPLRISQSGNLFLPFFAC